MPIPNKTLRSILGLLLLALLSSSAQSDPAAASYIAQGDRLFEQMKYKEAVAAYAPDSNIAEAQWKMARAYICYADIIKTNREYYYNKATLAARRCIQMDPKNGSAHEIKKELDIAIAINPNDDIALSILGSFYRVLGDINWLERNLATLFLGGIPEGGYEDSEKYFFRAIKVSPNTMRHWFELGLLYKSWGKKDKEKDAFLKAQKCPIKMASDKDRLDLIAKYLKD